MYFKKLILIFLLFICNSQSQESDNEIRYQGFFNFYHKTDLDQIHLEVNKLNKEFLYVSSLSSGIGSNDIGMDRGQLGSERIVKFVKYGNKLLLIQPNQKFKAISENYAEKNSVEEAFAKSIIFGFEIINSNKETYTIDITPFLMRDFHGVSNRLKSLKQGNYKVDLSRSAIEPKRTKAFLKNVEFDAILTFVGKPEGKLITSVAPDASSVTVNQHHSFVELPDEEYHSRDFDPRSGAFMISYMDYATPVQDPIMKRLITRHRLVKKNPELKMSEAVEPIIYYLDPGTPEPIRSALIEGASWWNEAFEEIGFKNAFQVKILPENADPMDCRFNVIQWVHRSTRGWSYGSNVVDPRTGEIIKGHVSLGSLRIRQDFMIAQALLEKPFEKGNDYSPMLEMALARIRQLSAHEVGHTLGFAHNFASSSNNRASVMDYPHPLIGIKNKKIDLSNAYDTGIGDWDKVSVAYSYSEFDQKNERDMLNQILEDSHKKGLRFISDRDARAPDGSHFYAHLWDNGGYPHQALNDILKIREIAIANFSKYNIRKGEPYSKLEDLFVLLYFMHRYQAEATVKLVGGMDYNYASRGDGQLIVKDLDASVQSDALISLMKSISAENLAIPKKILKLFPPRAYGYSRTRESFGGKTGISFDPLSAASTATDLVVNLLLNPKRLNRIVIQNSIDNSNLNLNTLFSELIKYTFSKKHKDSYLSEIQNQINTTVLIQILKLSNDSEAFSKTKIQALDAINRIQEISLKFKNNGNNFDQYIHIIDDYNKSPEKYQRLSSPKIPDGSPIGHLSCN